MDELIEQKKRTALTGWPMIIGWLAMLIFAFHASTHMVGAGDTWVAMACGRHFINHGVDTVEPFSANSHRAGPTEEDVKTWPSWAQWITEKAGLETVQYWHPTGWVNQNWLTHVIFYWLTHESPFADAEARSFNTLVYWKFAIYIITVICIYYMGRLLGVNPALSAIFACFAMFVGRSFFDIRPAGFSNLLVAMFLLVLVLTAYRNVLYIWLIVPITVFWCNVHGGYIYVFIMLVPFVGLNLLTSVSKTRFSTIGLRGVIHTMAAGFVALVAAIIFNPFHLTNFTHTFIISASEHAEMWRSVNEWHPAFEWGNPVGDEIPFLIMYIIAWIVFVAWAVGLIVTGRSLNKRMPKRRDKIEGDYQFPKIDLALIVIASLTIYMAIRSRRFIPIAGIVACPVIAMLIDQMIRAISAADNFSKRNKLCVSAMPEILQKFFILGGVAAVLFFGTWWGLKFKRVYLDPWPPDPDLNSVFIRMTASDAKPFYAMDFIRMNKLKGKMFNYWTEGGFIVWGQDPDPNTGKTPLQLFMDGRAQAAYEPQAYKTWMTIMTGGQTGARLISGTRARGTKLSNANYVKIGKAVSKLLRDHNVWAVLMPWTDPKVVTGPFVKGIERNLDWPIVFLNHKQRFYVDINSPQGKELIEGMFNGKTLYPDEYSRSMALATNMLLYGKEAGEHKKGLDFAIKAFESYPAALPMQGIMKAYRFKELKPQVDNFCKYYFDKFMKNKEEWSTQDGYLHKVMAARMAASHLARLARQQKNEKLVAFFIEKSKEYTDEQTGIMKWKRW